ncbi:MULTISPECIES: thymidine phosphorylase [Deinococcus]|uniref:Thymidine phosphorylase n=2 Tax=Deinococcus soli (ex Cha et al. 2016) TaxID=1309411 RepID=A0A0F7JRR6_9DEIO|nr:MULTISPECIES: thymidine phosphorylase [Deinococcus]AKH17315.1 thymidine phosphorylase [Deinococcus soli (ex Cha et al. 2016)]MDK2014617.1 thymidine phosphorylase [Deinococcus sp. 43]MDR6219127.1 pyrimidine-nucleoside phosphorylase/thymidine phosphorylase [Deinococcus soli (ex Cha et al. 2016)]MDR6329376.1 pyrimidine-nucleoside phosphorylase/thymidine phosphorylase [Deinococcus soli (ex Cha et al. 2016)]MDR6752036.1 pyrimidine-nucleoside phosphorylase/thymidine phosphorylase [Deinococcus sol
MTAIIPDLIRKKRDGLEHTREELETLVLGYTRGDVPDYQMSAWLMAVFLRGMAEQETADLTMVMAESGDLMNLGDLPRTVDKHSTGGVGDKTSLILTPMLAALGQTVAKMSGRGLAHTGGTIDKLESIPGWTSELEEEQFLTQAREIGLALVGQSRDLAPADGKLYALRDVTATVDCLPLIASSIMSKKLASGAHTVVLDVKVGAGAFMRTLDAGRGLARAMVDIGTRAGRQVRAVLTDMDTPLGHMAGNSLEVLEALATLRGEGPTDLTELCVALAVEALAAQGEDETAAEARARATLQDGSALAKFRAFIAAQGGDATYVDDVSKFDVAPGRADVTAPESGFVAGIDALSVGRAVLVLGGGRERKGEAIDHGVGVELLRKPGEAVRAGEPVLRIYHRGGRGLDAATRLLTEGLTLGAQAPAPEPLILDRVF